MLRSIRNVKLLKCVSLICLSPLFVFYFSPFQKLSHTTRMRENKCRGKPVFLLNIVSLFRAIYAFMPKMVKIKTHREQFDFLCKQNFMSTRKSIVRNKGNGLTQLEIDLLTWCQKTVCCWYLQNRTGETISDHAECNVQLWNSPSPCCFLPVCIQVWWLW